MTLQELNALTSADQGNIANKDTLLTQGNDLRAQSKTITVTHQGEMIL